MPKIKKYDANDIQEWFNIGCASGFVEGLQMARYILTTKGIDALDARIRSASSVNPRNLFDAWLDPDPNHSDQIEKVS